MLSLRMQANPSLISSPSLSSYCNDDQFSEASAKLSQDFNSQLKLIPSAPDVKTSADDEDHQRSELPKVEEGGGEEEDNDDEGEDEDDDDDDFTFACVGADKSPISAEDCFDNGQIRPVFPLFNRDLLFADEDTGTSGKRLSRRPPVKNFFIEEPPPMSSSSSSESDEIDGVAAGPYCAWSKKDSESSQEVCKKSNSTGFSKLWRFRDYLNRSNSDGRDAFVFLNNSPAASPKRGEKAAEKSDGSSEKKPFVDSSLGKKTAGEVKVKAKAAGGKVKAKKGVKGKTAPLSAHEIYTRNRGLREEEDRRRSYLPYRPEIVGFFTNVNGGLSRNVHPF